MAAIAAVAAIAPLQATPGAARYQEWPQAGVAAARTDLQLAQRIYREGVLPSGEPLRGAREGGLVTQGRAAACVNCHRRSGLGANEGRIIVPPITGKYLFRPGSRPLPEAAVQGPAASSQRQQRYDAQMLARAIRQGINADGKVMSALMPRFDIPDRDLALLINYLGTLGAAEVPGVSAEEIHFATVVTPDADPVQRDAMLAVLQHFFTNKNDFERGHDPPLVSARRIHYRVVRKWQLQVWQLSGPVETWEEQLDRRYREAPVFALISGIGGADWSPVHRFCERQQVPCLFPNIALPPVAERDFYPLYFSRGVLLESDLIAEDLQHAAAQGGAGRVIQVYRRGSVGQAAADALRAHFTLDARLRWEVRALSAQPAQGDLREALADISERDLLVLWLGQDDLRALPHGARVDVAYASGLMGGMEEAPVPDAWRSHLKVAYTVDLPQRRAIRLTAPLLWFRTQGIGVTALRTQVDTYIACQVLAEAIGHAFGELVPDFVVEQLENMISLKLFDGYFPRLGLAPGQRFASKGGYLVRLPPGPGDPQPLTAWLTP